MGPSFCPAMSSPCSTENARGERAELARGRELPEAPRVGLCLDVGARVPGESVEVWVASDLWCKARAAVEAASLTNAIAWKVFLLSGSS